MLKTEIKTVYYEADVIKQVICDGCGKDITEEKFFTVTVKYAQVDEQNKSIEKVYDENSCHIYLCKECAEEKVNPICYEALEYITDSLL